MEAIAEASSGSAGRTSTSARPDSGDAHSNPRCAGGFFSIISAPAAIAEAACICLLLLGPPSLLQIECHGLLARPRTCDRVGEYQRRPNCSKIVRVAAPSNMDTGESQHEWRQR